MCSRHAFGAYEKIMDFMGACAMCCALETLQKVQAARRSSAFSMASAAASVASSGASATSAFGTMCCRQATLKENSTCEPVVDLALKAYLEHEFLMDD